MDQPYHQHSRILCNANLINVITLYYNTDSNDKKLELSPSYVQDAIILKYTVLALQVG